VNIPEELTLPAEWFEEVHETISVSLSVPSGRVA
jgi:hypothetical protein